MNNIWSWAKGKKTYFAGIAGIVSTITLIILGTVEAQEGLPWIITFLGMMGIRHGLGGQK